MITIKTSIYSMLIITISAACRLRVEPAVDRAWARNLHPWTIHAHATNGTTEAVPQQNRYYLIFGSAEFTGFDQFT